MSSASPARPGAKRILVVANETVGGRRLIDLVSKKAEEARAEGGSATVTVICPQNEPRHGYVVYDELVRSAAENRLNTTLAALREAGVEADGEVMDPDPYTAVRDAVDVYGADEVIISTHPETRSGWLRKDLVERVREETGLPVDHVVVDLDADREDALRVLVVANKTIGGEPLLELLRGKAREGPRRFILICPQTDEEEEAARVRLSRGLRRFEEAGLDVIGQVMDPDPFTAVQNAMQFYAPDEIVISTYPERRSRWLRGDLVERVRATTSRPVEHVVSEEADREDARGQDSDPEEAPPQDTDHEEAPA